MVHRSTSATGCFTYVVFTRKGYELSYVAQELSLTRQLCSQGITFNGSGMALYSYYSKLKVHIVEFEFGSP